MTILKIGSLVDSDKNEIDANRVAGGIFVAAFGRRLCGNRQRSCLQKWRRDGEGLALYASGARAISGDRRDSRMVRTERLGKGTGFQAGGAGICRASD